MSCFMDFLDADDAWVNDGIDGLPFQDDDAWVNDGIDGMPFPDDESFQEEKLAEGKNNKVFAKVREFFRRK